MAETQPLEADMAGRGPLPTGTAVRRNQPTIPTTNLPSTGRTTPIPKPPALYVFGDRAADWWAWAWRTPQACAWDDGSLFAVARRAQLEDQIETVERATERSAVAREMRELDDRLGLTPKGLAALRWKIIDAEAEPKNGAGPQSGRDRRGLKVVPQAS